MKQYASAWWRLHNLYWIRNEAGERVRFIPNWVQEDLLTEMWYCNLILKARQLGCSTFIDLFLLDACVWNPNVAAAIIADTEDKAKEIFDNIVRFAYENLPEWVKHGVVVEEDNRSSIAFDNGSSIMVGVSIRGLTFQYLHISELGKIARYSPEKAEEIRTGAINTIHAGQIMFVESTAQGMEGLFYELCDKAIKAKAEKRELTPLSFKFHFYPWYLDERYMLSDEDTEKVVISEEKRAYFDKLEADLGIELAAAQRAWYVAKEDTQGERMKQEYPSTPQEAFESSLEGKILAREMAKARAEGRILPRVPVIPNIPVNTFWDIGHHDPTAIWFHQRVGPENRLIRFYKNSGYGLAHYVTYLRSHGYLLGKLYLPHDAEHKRLTGQMQGKSVVDHLYEMGFTARDIEIVPRPEDKWRDGIDPLRSFLVTCVFDGGNCAEGIKDLDNYKKQWNAQLGCWRDLPAEDDACHGADALETGARMFTPPPTTARRKRSVRQPNWRTV
ncbi:MAG TPA: hypothetical protein VNK67_02900 [Burkholderiales bacterium]|nr:hypothetical protein [Burkholderiales bacterium]